MVYLLINSLRSEVAYTVSAENYKVSRFIEVCMVTILSIFIFSIYSFTIIFHSFSFFSIPFHLSPPPNQHTNIYIL
jgi:hypothetical protein